MEGLSLKARQRFHYPPGADHWRLMAQLSVHLYRAIVLLPLVSLVFVNGKLVKKKIEITKFLYNPYLIISIQNIIMNLFKKQAPITVEVKGHPLVCPICSNNLFNAKDIKVLNNLWPMWTRAFICSECTYMFWFRD